MRRAAALVSAAVVAGAAVGAGAVGLGASSAWASTPIALLLPQSTAFGYVGHSCGGIQEQSYATGFDATTGYPTGDVHMRTSCGGSGRGGGYHSTVYSAWASATWDFTGAVVSSAATATATYDANFSATDASGNQLYDQSSTAYLLLAPGFVPAPRVTGVTPVEGPAAGGTTVAVTGTGFTNTTAVSFGSVAASSYSVNSDTSITAVAPAASPGTVDVVVSSAGGPSSAGSADRFTFVAAPVVTSLTPSRGTVLGGTTVTIAGSNFTLTTGVTIGGTAVGFTVDSDSAITLTTPPAEAPDSEQVTVTSPGGSSAPGAASTFTYTGASLSLSPTSGPPGTAVTARGHGFAPGETVTVRYQTGLTSPTSVLVCSATASSTGAFSCAGHVPGASSAGPTGAHRLRAHGTSSGLSAAATFTLT